jgi:hypothetical protein
VNANKVRIYKRGPYWIVVPPLGWPRGADYPLRSWEAAFRFALELADEFAAFQGKR